MNAVPNWANNIEYSETHPEIVSNALKDWFVGVRFIAPVVQVNDVCGWLSTSNQRKAMPGNHSASIP